MRLDDGFGDCQPLAGFALAAMPRFLNAAEALEDIAELIGRDACAGVGHAQLKGVAFKAFEQVAARKDLPRRFQQRCEHIESCSTSAEGAS